MLLDGCSVGPVNCQFLSSPFLRSSSLLHTMRSPSSSVVSIVFCSRLISHSDGSDIALIRTPPDLSAHRHIGQRTRHMLYRCTRPGIPTAPLKRTLHPHLRLSLRLRRCRNTPQSFRFCLHIPYHKSRLLTCGSVPVDHSRSVFALSYVCPQSFRFLDDLKQLLTRQ